MMKGMIRGNVDTETKAVQAAFVNDFIKAKNFGFVEKKAPVISRGKKGRSNMMVESSNVLKKIADKERKQQQKVEEAKQEEERRKAKELEAKRHDAEDWIEYLKLFAIDIATLVMRYAENEPTNFLIICVLLMLLYVN